MAVVLEPAVLLHAPVQGRLARMAERRMTEVMGQSDRLSQVFVKPQPPRDRPANLSDFQRVRQPSAVVVVRLIDEDLRLIHQPTKSRGVNDAIAVALIRRAKEVR